MTDERAKKDLKNSIGGVRGLGLPTSIRSFDEIGAYDETNRDGGERAMIVFTIGMRGELTPNAAQSAAGAWRGLVAQYPKGNIYPQIAGYDDDLRELWDIPETRDYVCRWATLAGLDDFSAVAASPLNEHALGFLAKCGAIKDVDPHAVEVGKPLPGLPGGSPLKH